jgi:hypothetical protein
VERGGGVEERLGALVPPPGAATTDDRLSVLERVAGDAVADGTPVGEPAGAPVLAKVLGGRLDAVVARLVHLESTVRVAAAGLDVARGDGVEAAGAAGAGAPLVADADTAALERQIVELNRILG